MTIQAAPSDAQPTPAPAPEPPGDSAPQSLGERMLASVKAKKAAAAPPPAAAPPEEPAEAAPAPADEPPAAPGNDEIADLARKLTRQQKAYSDLEKRFRRQEAEHKEAQELLDKAKGDPKAWAESNGLTLDEWNEAVLKGDGEAKTPEQVEIEKANERLAKLEKEREDERKAVEEREKQAGEERDREAVRGFVQGDIEKYGLVDTFGAHEAVRTRYYEKFTETGEKPDLAAVAAEVQTELVQGVRKMAQSDAFIAALASDATVKSKILEALGASPPGETSEDTAPQANRATTERNGAPPPLTQDAAARGATRQETRPRSKEERQRAATAVVHKVFGRG